jgi:hypothetical protein
MKNRDTKYRIWNGNEMLYPDGIHLRCDGNVAYSMSDFSGKYIQYAAVSADHLKMTEFAHLKDIKGNDVYEGDIVEYKKHKKVVVWDTAHLCFIMVWLKYFVPDAVYRYGSPEEGGRYTFDKLTDTKKVLKLGNIFENPEMILST